jgi:hypothetical protein
MRRLHLLYNLHYISEYYAVLHVYDYDSNYNWNSCRCASAPNGLNDQ